MSSHGGQATFGAAADVCAPAFVQPDSENAPEPGLRAVSAVGAPPASKASLPTRKRTSVALSGQYSCCGVRPYPRTLSRISASTLRGSARRSTEEPLDQDRATWPDRVPGAVSHALLPDTVLITTPDDAQIIRGEPVPTPGTSVAWLIGGHRVPGKLEESRAAFDLRAFETEDLPVAVECQRGVSAGRSTRFVGRNGSVVQSWHRLWRETLDDRRGHRHPSRVNRDAVHSFRVGAAAPAAGARYSGMRTLLGGSCKSLCLTSLLVAFAAPNPAAAQTNPFEKEIVAFETQDAKYPPPPGAIIITGSSTIRLWNGIRNDLAPLDVIPRGFGGSSADDLDYFLDRIVLKYAPRAVAIYEGDTDLSQGLTPDYIVNRIGGIAARIQAQYPAAHLYFISIKPSPKRWTYWPLARQANEMLASLCATLPQCTYVDTATALLSPTGSLVPGHYASDRIHLSAAGYQIWSSVVRAALMAGEESGIPLPGLQPVDVGLVSVPGSTSENLGVVTASGSGVGAYELLDGMHFSHKLLSGKGAITIRLAGLDDAGTGDGLVGVMLRETRRGDSRYAFVYVTPQAGAGMMYRKSPREFPGPGIMQQPDVTAPRWLKLVRSYKVVTGFLSTDGVTWQQIGKVTFPSLSTNVYVGVAVSSLAPGSVVAATLDNAWISGAVSTPSLPATDLRAPKIPTNLKATALDSSSVRLTWTKATDSGSGICGYRVFRNGLIVGATTGNTWTDSGLAADTLHVYTVTAYDKGVPTNESLASTPASVSTPPEPVPEPASVP